MDRAWFARPPLEVAGDLLGALVRVERADGTVVVQLTEVEAYGGADDPASHAYRGPTDRNRVMFGQAGRLYVYRHLGLHHCANIVTGATGVPSAVLLRAGEVVQGKDVASRRRSAVGVVRRDVDLARGPARLAVALGLALGDDGLDLVNDRAVGIRRGTPPAEVRRGPRVGVAGEGADPIRFDWRIWVAGAPSVSPFRPGGRRPT